MSDDVFNVARGRLREKVLNGGANFGILILKAVEADATLADRATVADILAQAGNVEADFTNYIRKTGLSPTDLGPDNAAETASVDLANPTWANAGGATNNTTAKLIFFFDEGGTDATRIPMTFHDFVATTNGNDLNGIVDAAGFYGSQ